MAIIGIMDSGVGGLSVFREIRKALPEAGIVYYSDNANCPYGDKSTDFIQGRTRAITDILTSKGAQVVVIACNTATAASIVMLRQMYDIPFVGMEPAVKPAAQQTRTGVIGVLATAGTLSATKYLNTRGRFEGDVRIIEQVGRGFVELVERGELRGEHAESIVRESLRPILDAGADRVVLGCTHYPFLMDTLTKVASDLGYPDTVFMDPAPAIAKQLVKVMTLHGIQSNESDASVELLSSGDRTALERTYALIHEK